MPIIDRKTVTFQTNAIEGVSTIKYVDALFEDAWQPFGQRWEAYGFEVYLEGVEVTENLSDYVLEKIWLLVNQHQAKQHHENDDR